MKIDEVRREFYHLISQRSIASQVESTGRILLDYDRDNVNRRIKELGSILYDATSGAEGSKGN